KLRVLHDHRRAVPEPLPRAGYRYGLSEKFGTSTKALAVSTRRRPRIQDNDLFQVSNFHFKEKSFSIIMFASSFS
ncbi:MAG TPA: hypothetical protein VMB77_06160, partial [Syntrophales bacterium]|nr:hypothetical protein [Syntrophales bacterium]